MTLHSHHLEQTSAVSGQKSGAQPVVHLIQQGINLHWWNHNDNNSHLVGLSAKYRSLRIHSALGQIPGEWPSALSLITAARSSSFSFLPTYLCMVPTSAGRDERRFPDKFSSVSEEMSHKARGNSDRALFDRLRLLSLQNLERVRGSHWERRGEIEGRDRKKRADKEGHRC